jgi:hypothetical protein
MADGRSLKDLTLKGFNHPVLTVEIAVAGRRR